MEIEKEANGQPLRDENNTNNANKMYNGMDYTKSVQIPIYPEALVDDNGYLPVKFAVPAMGWNPTAVLKIDWASLKKIDTEEAPKVDEKKDNMELKKDKNVNLDKGANVAEKKQEQAVKEQVKTIKVRSMSDKAPKTGDGSNGSLYVVILIASAITAAYILRKKFA